jgi:hypothetical protein
MVDRRAPPSLNRFTERYRTEEHRKVRLREMSYLVIESFVLKKKRKYERKKKGAPMRDYRQNGATNAGVL